ncbi:MAG: hypothetical protein WD278_07680 [Pirellulales bacterium]
MLEFVMERTGCPAQWFSARQVDMATDGLKIELETYAANKDELLAKGDGKFVVISERAVVGIWETFEDALHAGYERFLPRPFLVKRIQRGEDTQGDLDAELAAWEAASDEAWGAID